MLIAQKKNVNDVRLVEKEISTVGADEVMIKVMSCGVCGGDLGSSDEYKDFGHEMAGIIEKVGSSVTNFKIGDKVVVESASFCGNCDVCRDGKVDLCDNVFVSKAGGFAEYAVIPVQTCVHLPEDISFKQAGIVEPLGVAIDLVKTADIHLGDHVLIYGTGTIGLMALQLAKKSGATKIYAVLRSRSKKKAELALKFGADDVIFSNKIALKDYKFPKKGVDKVLITAQNYVIPEALSVLNYGGSAVFLGFGGEHMISIDAHVFHVKKLQLKSSFARPGIYFPLAMETIRAGVIDTDEIITHTLPLAKIKELMYIAGEKREEVVKAVMLQE